MKERKFTRVELGYIESLCFVQFGDGELSAVRVSKEKLQRLEYKVSETGQILSINPRDMMEMFPTDPFYTKSQFWLSLASLICIGLYFYVG
jgi:hypothetical protein